VKTDDLIDPGPGSEIVCPSDSKWYEIGTQPVVTDSLKPFHRSVLIVAIEASIYQQLHLLLIRRRWLA
jgi:hypothetical protein